MSDRYAVRKIEHLNELTVHVPGSKSITNRALMLAALSSEQCTLDGVLFSDDSRAFLDCLTTLGFLLTIDEANKSVTIQGTGGEIPNKNAIINVRSAGTAARFLTVMLALAGGTYEINASSQMCKRPMKPILDILTKAGVIFEYSDEAEHFPFRMHSTAPQLQSVVVDTGISSQYASALLMAGALLENGLELQMEGDRAEGSYIKMTLAMMKQFGVCVERNQERYFIHGGTNWGIKQYQIEPDVSGACYFYAMAPLLKTNVMVVGVHSNSLQGDIKFIEVLKKLGCKISEEEQGIKVWGEELTSYPGIHVSMKDFSDQTMTLSALAPFATSPTSISNIGHIRFQETNRIQAIVIELNRMGIKCEEAPDIDGIRIYPGTVKATEVETYEDHRMAMAFTLIGLRNGGIVIKNPDCCRKTFENYFELIEELYV